MENKRAKFLRIYADILEELRNDIIAVVDGKTYTWNVAYREIKNNSQLGGKILKTLIDTGII
ncbi:MAG: hypothetical protein WC584_02115 [Candidatus Pacearchaeota archaeon]